MVGSLLLLPANQVPGQTLGVFEQALGTVSGACPHLLACGFQVKSLLVDNSVLSGEFLCLMQSGLRPNAGL